MTPFSYTTPKGVDVLVRTMTAQDVHAVVELNKASYPTLAEDNVVWRAEHLLAHMRIFPEGQIVVEHEGEIVGSASTLIVDLGRDPYRNHTYSGITDGGWFCNHDPDGDTLYGADVAVHPEKRSLGVGAAIYEARRRICQSLNLRRIVVGGRLFNYSAYASRMGAEEYARRVEAGELRDLVLSFQLNQGFVLKKVLPNYLHDRRSRDNASFLEWLNPDHVPPEEREQRKVRVSCVQYEMREIADFAGFVRQVEYFVDVAAGYRADFVVFPELMTAQLMSFIEVKTPREAVLRLADYAEELDAMFLDLARRYSIHIVGGSTPVRVAKPGIEGDRLENIASLYTPQGEIHRQSKLHITPNERRWWGIEGGSSIAVFDTPKARVGIAICYDVEFPELVRTLVDHGAEIVFVPFCTDDRQAYLRVRYCAQARAIENMVYLALAGNTGNLPNTANMDIQYAQSAILTPSDFPFARDGIQAEGDVNAEGVITCDLDLDTLRRAVTSGSVRPRLDRRTDLFQVLGPAAKPPRTRKRPDKTASLTGARSR